MVLRITKLTMLRNTTYALGFVFLLVNSSCYYDNKEDLYQYIIDEECTATEATFITDIVPIITDNCNRCHRNGREDGNVNLEGYNRVLPYAQNGQLLGTMDHAAGYSIMPPSGPKVSFCDIEKVKLWLDAGALDN